MIQLKTYFPQLLHQIHHESEPRGDARVLARRVSWRTYRKALRAPPKKLHPIPDDEIRHEGYHRLALLNYHNFNHDPRFFLPRAFQIRRLGGCRVQKNRCLPSHLPAQHRPYRRTDDEKLPSLT